MGLALVILSFASILIFKQFKNLEITSNAVMETQRVNFQIHKLYSNLLKIDNLTLKNIFENGQDNGIAIQKLWQNNQEIENELFSLTKEGNNQVGRAREYRAIKDSLLHITAMESALTGPEIDEGKRVYLKQRDEIFGHLNQLVEGMIFEENSLLAERIRAHNENMSLTPIMGMDLLLFSFFIIVFSCIRIIQNITALRQTEYFLTTILKNTTNLVNYVTPVFKRNQLVDFKIEFVNEVIEEFLQKKPAEIIGKNMTEIYPNAVKQGVLKTLVQVYETKKPQTYFNQISLKNGTFYIQTTAVRIENGVTLTTVDQTQQIKDKDRLLILNKKLDAQNKQLSDKNLELESFNRVASHDLQEPLRKIQLFISRIASSGKELSEDHKTYFNMIMTASERMQELIKNLLIFSKLDKTINNEERIDLNEICSEVKEQYQEEISTGELVINCMDLPVVIGEKYQFYQLFYNLISNSIKYKHCRRPAHVKIMAETVDSHALHGILESDVKEYHQITVKDNGIGFDQKYSQKIFEPFERIHANALYKGTGIGLGICKKIALNHHGDILAYGTPGVGAEFVIYLPKREVEAILH